MAQPKDVERETVNLISDDEGSEPFDELLDLFDVQFPRRLAGYAQDQTPMDEAMGHSNLGQNIIDLTAIPDMDVPPSEPGAEAAFQPVILNSDETPQDNQWFTQEECLRMILNVLPDISNDYALGLIREKTTDATRTDSRCNRILSDLLDGIDYPKEQNRGTKRKRSDEDSYSDYDTAERDPEENEYERSAIELLMDEFLKIPARHITNIVKDHKTLFRAYIVLMQQVREYNQVTTGHMKTSRTRNSKGIETILINRGSKLPKELYAARNKENAEQMRRQKAIELKRDEEDNLRKAQSSNQMSECSCCFDDFPLNRMISCSGGTSHFFCKSCPRQQVETEMGQSRCRPKCFAVNDCDGSFSRAQLEEVLGETSFERLEHMQQLEDLSAANLDFLSECPFCDFKMECPPIEIDKEFRCQNSRCGKTTCRICQKESHIPLSCDEAKKDGHLTLRHLVEEAMSKALIRHCNKCNKPFIKDFGCNKMTCTHCKNKQCYTCSEDIKDYRHFGEMVEGKCVLHDNVEANHERQVTEAAKETMAKVRAENPGVSDADLMLKVSDRIKEDDPRLAREIPNRPNVEDELHAHLFRVENQVHQGIRQMQNRHQLDLRFPHHMIDFQDPGPDVPAQPPRQIQRHRPPLLAPRMPAPNARPPVGVIPPDFGQIQKMDQALPVERHQQHVQQQMHLLQHPPPYTPFHFRQFQQFQQFQQPAQYLEQGLQQDLQQDFYQEHQQPQLDSNQVGQQHVWEPLQQARDQGYPFVQPHRRNWPPRSNPRRYYDAFALPNMLQVALEIPCPMCGQQHLLDQACR